MLSYEILSKNGSRETNEDSVGMSNQEDVYCFVLADGLGGHQGGEVASRIFVEGTITLFQSNQDGDGLIEKSFEENQERILQEQGSNHLPYGYRTTGVILYIGKEEVQWGHIGDSRMYYFDHNKLQGRTLDHSVPQMLVAAGRLKEKQIRGHADRSRLLRVMGEEWEGPSYELSMRVHKQSGQAFLLCSDGFWECITEKEMLKCLKKAANAKQWVEWMEQIARKNGSKIEMDNYSAIGIMIQ